MLIQLSTKLRISTYPSRKKIWMLLRSLRPGFHQMPRMPSVKTSFHHSVINAPRLDGHHGGGLAIIYCEHVKVALVLLKITPSAFVVLLVRIIIGAERFFLANIYQPPGGDVVTFLDEFSDLDETLTILGGYLIYLGDFNTPRKAPNELDEWFATWLSCYNFLAVNEGPIHLHSNESEDRLDLIIEPEKTRHLSSVKKIPVGYSDHRLVKLTLDCARSVTPWVMCNYHDFQRMDVCAFTSYLRQTITFIGASLDVDEAVHQFKQDITRGLDRFATICIKTKTLGRLGNKWRTTETNEAKKETSTRDMLLENTIASG